MSKCKYKCSKTTCEIECKNITFKTPITYEQEPDLLRENDLCIFVDSVKEMAKHLPKELKEFHEKFCKRFKFPEEEVERAEKGAIDSISEEAYETLKTIEEYSGRELIEYIGEVEEYIEEEVSIGKHIIWLVDKDDILKAYKEALKRAFSGVFEGNSAQKIFCSHYTYSIFPELVHFGCNDENYKVERCSIQWIHNIPVLMCNVSIKFKIHNKLIKLISEEMLKRTAKCLVEYYEKGYSDCAVPLMYLEDALLIPTNIPQLKIYHLIYDALVEYNQGKKYKICNVAEMSTDTPGFYEFTKFESLRSRDYLLSDPKGFVNEWFYMHYHSRDTSFQPFPCPINKYTNEYILPLYRNQNPGIFLKESLHDMYEYIVNFIDKITMGFYKYRREARINDLLLTIDILFMIPHRLLSF